MLRSRIATGARPLASVADNPRELVSTPSTPSASKALTTPREGTKLGARHVARARSNKPVNIVSTKLFVDEEVLARAGRAWEAVEENEPIDGTLDEGAYCEGYFAPSDDEVNNLMEGELLKGDVLYSTIYHRTIVASAALAALGLFAEGVSTTSAPSVALAVVLGYVFSDLGSGIFHWSVDNYGSEKTPAFGGVIAAFQGHHLYPWTITTREFCNNIHKVATPAISIQILWLMAPLPGSVDVFLAVLSTMVILSQQFHSWAHTRKSQLPAPVIALQDAGVIISRKAHGQHHRLPFDGNYCIVTGLWNNALDKNGFFRNLEALIYEKTKVEPRCWKEPDYKWVKGSTSKYD